MEDRVVQMKTDAAVKYCETASVINAARNEKPWRYVLIPHDKTDTNMSFMRLVTEYGRSMSATIA